MSRRNTRAAKAARRGLTLRKANPASASDQQILAELMALDFPGGLTTPVPGLVTERRFWLGMADGRVVGGVFAEYFTWQGRDAALTGWALLPRHRGKGYATTMARELPALLPGRVLFAAIAPGHAASEHTATHAEFAPDAGTLAGIGFSSDGELALWSRQMT
jgi:RimJ/RimL family protein N-acetyltransferase